MTGDPFVETCTALGGEVSGETRCFVEVPPTRKWLSRIGKVLREAMDASRKAGRDVSWVFLRDYERAVELEYLHDAGFPFRLTVETRTARTVAPIDGHGPVGVAVKERIGSHIVTAYGWTSRGAEGVGGYGVASVTLPPGGMYTIRALLPRIARVASRAARKALARYEKGLGPDAAALPPVFARECRSAGGKVVYDPDEVPLADCHVGARWFGDAVRMAKKIYRALATAGASAWENSLPVTPLFAWTVWVDGEEAGQDQVNVVEVFYSPYADEWKIVVRMEGYGDPREAEAWAPARRVRVIHSVNVEATATIREEDGRKRYEVEATASVEGEVDARDLHRLLAAAVDEAEEAYYDMVED